MRKLAAIMMCVFLWPCTGMAGTIVHYFKVQSGTGFFVNNMYVITNAHVVNGCDRVIIKGAVSEREVNVRVLDSEHDLALLETNQPPREFAPLRFNIDDLHPGDKVYVVGYPGEAGARGEYKMAAAQIVNLTGVVQGTPGQFYISDVIEHGNSGGPVFDASGNVIGVVVAKSTLTTINKETNEKISQQRVGVGISLATLKDFLYNHGIYTELNGSGLLYSDDYIEEHAKNYIVNVQCRTPVDQPYVPENE